MQRLFNLTKWQRLVEGRSLSFPTARARVVRLEVNAPRAVGLYLFDAATGEALFIARVEGRDTVEFYSGGNFELVSDGEVYVYTADGESVHYEAIDPVIFTRIVERRQLNPEIAAIQRAMNINIERRLAAQRDEFNEAIRRMQSDRKMAARREAEAAAEPKSGDDGGGDETPPVADSGAAEPAAPADSDNRRKRK